MRRTISAGILLTLALLIPAAPAVAGTASPGLDAACQTVERKVYRDIRKMVTIDLDTAHAVQVQILATRILEAAEAESLSVLSGATQDRLNGTDADLRSFLKDGVRKAWSVDLRISVVRTLTDTGANVNAAAQKALDTETVDAYLAHLNDGLYTARALDCASRPSPSPSVKPSATTTVAPSPTASTGPSTPGPSSASPDAPGGEGGGLPVTGAGTGTVAAVGGALLILGGAGYLIGRRRRSRFVA